MSLVKLETSLLKVKKSLQDAKQVNKEFDKVLDDLYVMKQVSFNNPELKEKYSEVFKEKKIIDLFSSIEQDFQEIRKQLLKQELQKNQVLDFVESLRISKEFFFDDTNKTMTFLLQTIEELNADIISVKPEFIGTIDFSEIAIELGVCKTGSGIVVQKELFNELLTLLLTKKMFRNTIFETNNAKINLKSSNNLVIESDNLTIRKISRLK